MTVYTNGNIPKSVMKTFGGKYGHPVFIDQLTAFAAECRVHGITVYLAPEQDIFRDYAGQVYWKNYWTARGVPGNAATPGTSNHGLGVAADISGIGGWGSATHNTVVTIAARHGLKFTVPSESWHIQSTRISTAGNRVTINGGGATNDIRQLQTDLHFLGYNVGIDGIDGQNTRDGVTSFQRDHKLGVDGIAGGETKAKLREIITTIQNLLKNAGFNPGSSDGLSGANTVAAVKAFQTARGIAVDGRVGNQTFGELNKPANNNPPGAVLSIQKALNKLGASPKLAEDDLPGPATTAAIKAFQKKHGLLEDGLVGNGTWNVINIELEKLNVTPIPEPTPVPPTPVPPVVPAAVKVVPVYPGALESWETLRGKDKRDAGSKITALAIHHTASVADHLAFFKNQNNSPAPTWYVRGKEVFEFVRPENRPITTAKANNYTVSIETQNTSGAPEWKVSEESVESIAQIAAWLHSFDGKTLNGVPVEFKLDRAHIKGHREFPENATECPGPYLYGRLDYIVTRAREIYAAEYAPPVDPVEPDVPPTPTPEPTPADNDNKKAWAAASAAITAIIAILAGLVATITEIFPQ